MALAWALRDPRVTSALIGASSVAQLEANVAALDNARLHRRRARRDRPLRDRQLDQHLGPARARDSRSGRCRRELGRRLACVARRVDGPNDVEGLRVRVAPSCRRGSAGRGTARQGSYGPPLVARAVDAVAGQVGFACRTARSAPTIPAPPGPTRWVGGAAGGVRSANRYGASRAAARRRPRARPCVGSRRRPGGRRGGRSRCHRVRLAVGRPLERGLRRARCSSCSAIARRRSSSRITSRATPSVACDRVSASR